MATIHRPAEYKPMTEDASEIGKGFSVDVTASWERSFSFLRNVSLAKHVCDGKDIAVLLTY